MPLQLPTTMIAHNYTVSIELYFTLREAMIQWSFSRMHHQHGQTLVNMSTVSKQCHQALIKTMAEHANDAKPYFQTCNPEIHIKDMEIPEGELDNRLNQYAEKTGPSKILRTCATLSRYWADHQLPIADYMQMSEPNNPYIPEKRPEYYMWETVRNSNKFYRTKLIWQLKAHQHIKPMEYTHLNNDTQVKETCRCPNGCDSMAIHFSGVHEGLCRACEGNWRTPTHCGCSDDPTSKCCIPNQTYQHEHQPAIKPHHGPGKPPGGNNTTGSEYQDIEHQPGPCSWISPEDTYKHRERQQKRPRLSTPAADLSTQHQQPNDTHTCEQPSIPAVNITTQQSNMTNAQPTTELNNAPSAQSYEPNSTPSAQPASEPSSPPSAQPSSKPNITPSAQPTPEPNSTPSAQPSSEPSSTQSAQPSIELGSTPTTRINELNTPDTHPASEPSSTPCAQPSTMPDSTPNAQPPSYESSSTQNEQPAYEPSGIHHAQPKSELTSTPAALPALELNSALIAQPLSETSNTPSAQQLRQQQPDNQTDNQTYQYEHQPETKPHNGPGKPPGGNNTTSSEFEDIEHQPGPSSWISPEDLYKHRERQQQRPRLSAPAADVSTQHQQPNDTHTYEQPLIPAVNITTQQSNMTNAQPTTELNNTPSAQPCEPSSTPIAQTASEPSSPPTDIPPWISHEDYYKHQGRQQKKHKISASPNGMSAKQQRQNDAPLQSQPSTPADNITAQPFRALSTQPAYGPIGTSNAQPLFEPSSTPSTQPPPEPSSTPSAQPALEQSRTPSTPSSSEPCSPPEPSSQPSEPPALEPSSAPTEQPVPEPKNAPNAQRSSELITASNTQLQRSSRRGVNHTTHTQQTGRPPADARNARSGMPTTAPARRATARAQVTSAQPSGAPSAQPVSQPSSAPSAQPVPEPSSTPSMQPAPEPSNASNAQRPSEPVTASNIQPQRTSRRGVTYTTHTQQTGRQGRQQKKHKISASPNGMSAKQQRPNDAPLQSQPSTPADNMTAQPVRALSTQPAYEPNSTSNAQPLFEPSSTPSAQPPSGLSNKVNTRAQPPSEPNNTPSAQPAPEQSRTPNPQSSSEPCRPSGAHPAYEHNSTPNAQGRAPYKWNGSGRVKQVLPGPPGVYSIYGTREEAVGSAVIDQVAEARQAVQEARDKEGADDGAAADRTREGRQAKNNVQQQLHQTGLLPPRTASIVQRQVEEEQELWRTHVEWRRKVHDVMEKLKGVTEEVIRTAPANSQIRKLARVELKTLQRLMECEEHEEARERMQREGAAQRVMRIAESTGEAEEEWTAALQSRAGTAAGGRLPPQGAAEATEDAAGRGATGICKGTLHGSK